MPLPSSRRQSADGGAGSWVLAGGREAALRDTCAHHDHAEETVSVHNVPMQAAVTVGSARGPCAHRIARKHKLRSPTRRASR